MLKQLVDRGGSELSSDHPRFLSVAVDFTAAAWNTVAFQRLFAVTGVVRLRILAVCTALLGSAAAGGENATVELGTIADTDAFIPATDEELVDAGEIWCSAVDADISKQPTVGNGVIDVIVNGTNVGITIAVEALTVGTMTVYAWWDAISTDGAVVVGAGEGT
jgi:hypothetical protein